MMENTEPKKAGRPRQIKFPELEGIQDILVHQGSIQNKIEDLYKQIGDKYNLHWKDVAKIHLSQYLFIREIMRAIDVHRDGSDILDHKYNISIPGLGFIKLSGKTLKKIEKIVEDDKQRENLERQTKK